MTHRNMIRIPSRGEIIAAYDRRPTTIERSYRKAGKRFSDEPSLAELVYVIAGVVVGLATIWWLS